MEIKEKVLSQNIKHLRRRNQLSQEDLAFALGIKRSNIAAYESKNVEPRLRIILEIAKLFNVSIKTLIETKIEDGIESPPFDALQFGNEKKPQKLDIKDNDDIHNFIDKSIKIRKVLEGFKAFYTFKKNTYGSLNAEKEKLTFDIDNFIQLMDHLLAYNETVIKAISNKNQSLQQS
ncbi:MAG: helix-turn-helix domain-containing protein [Saprospiraceae bacterium]|nr:helix-turn-helix domain-containing protein [Saprospiraceae bacterium]